MEHTDQVFEGEVWDGKDAAGQEMSAIPAAVSPGVGMVQARTPYVAAMQVLKPRDMDVIERSILRQAAMVGEKAMYGWGAGKGRVEGISAPMAMIMFNAFGNMTIVAEPVHETPEAWVFTHYIVDLETGASAPRQWRESKRSKVDGNMDADRKDAIRFGRGQSKNMRNVIVNRMPRWLIHKVIEEAKKGARDKLAKYIEKNGLAAAQTYAVEQLRRHGVTEEQIIEKMGKAEVKGLDIDDLVLLSADLHAIDSGEEHASTLFPSTKEAPAKLDLKEKLKSQVQKGKKEDADAKAVTDMKVRLGSEPYSWIVNDGMKEYLVAKRGHDVECSCPQRKNCLHVLAMERFTAGV
jgi:hypothetical protein